MATSTLIQKLDSTAFESSKTVPGSYTSVTTPDVSNRRQVETFIAGSTVAVGDWLAFDTSKTGAVKVLTVIPAANVALGNALVVGVCLGSADSDGSLTAGSKINVIISGYAETAKVVAGVAAAGVPLAVVASTPSAEANVAANIARPCGVSLAASAAGVAPVWIFKAF